MGVPAGVIGLKPAPACHRQCFPCSNLKKCIVESDLARTGSTDRGPFLVALELPSHAIFLTSGIQKSMGPCICISSDRRSRSRQGSQVQQSPSQCRCKMLPSNHIREAAARDAPSILARNPGQIEASYQFINPTSLHQFSKTILTSPVTGSLILRNRRRSTSNHRQRLLPTGGGHCLAARDGVCIQGMRASRPSAARYKLVSLLRIRRYVARRIDSAWGSVLGPVYRRWSPCNLADALAPTIASPRRSKSSVRSDRYPGR